MQTIPVNCERLRAYRQKKLVEKKPMTQVQLSAAANVSRSYIAEIEKGLKQPSFLVADALAEALDITVDDLVSTKVLRPSDPAT